MNLISLEGKPRYLEFKSDIELNLKHLMFSIIYINRLNIKK